MGGTRRYTFRLQDCPPDIGVVGGKAASLARLTAAGMPVPPAFVVTTDAYRCFVSENGIEPEIARFAASVAGEVPRSDDDAGLIKKLFEEGVIPPEITDAVTRSYEELAGHGIAVAVRSSATAEDLPEASFAGQQETYLNVTGSEAVLRAVKLCWASLWTPRATLYRSRLRVAPESVALAVIVQILVPAEASGVLFTADPVSGGDDVVAISAAWGLGNAVVGGLVNADSITAKKADGLIVKRTVEDKRVMSVRTETGVEERPVPDDLRRKPVLTDAQVSRLRGIGVDIERLYGTPMDIEWARHADGLFVVQARPITVRGAPAGRRRAASSDGGFAWNDSEQADCLWSNVNFGEAISDVMTPLTWSAVRFILEDWVIVPGRPNVGIIGGYCYMNVSVFFSIYTALGRSRASLLKTMEPTLHLSIPDDMEIPTFSVSKPLLLRILARAARVRYRQWRGWMRHKPCVETNRAWFERVRRLIEAEETAPGLAHLFRTEVGPHVKRNSWSVLGCVDRSAAYTMKLRRDLSALVGPEEANHLLTNLGDGSGHLASMGPVIGLADVAAGRMSKERYLEEYGHRGPHEFELSVPRPAEDPAWVDRQLAQQREHPADVAGLLERQRERFDSSWQRFVSGHPHKASRMAKRIARSAELARLRELSRSVYVRDRWAVRLFAVRAGRLTGLGDDVFFLTLPEVLAVLAGDKEATRHIAERKQAFLGYKALPPYPPLIRGRFDPYAWAADPERRGDIFDPAGHGRPLKAPSTEDRFITGTPGSAGLVTGKVRYLSHPDEASALQPGEVLLTTKTDIEWTVVFPRAAAVVTDVGAPLSHAAIVARELGIPAVVGCRDATTRLKTGDTVLVDGSRGTVQILEYAQGPTTQTARPA